MRIHAFNFTCNRDTELSNLMVHTLFRHCQALKEMVVINTDYNQEYKEYGNGSGWGASMLKLKRLREFNIDDDSWVLSVDSDVVFGGPDVFSQLDRQYGIIGRKHRPEYHTHFGQWSHMSGALIFIRGDIAKRMGRLNGEELDRIRFQHFKAYQLTENEDVVLSYLATYCGAVQFDLPGFVSSNDFEQHVKDKEQLRSYYHLNYCPTQFLGEPVTGKWDIPKVLQNKGINL